MEELINACKILLIAVKNGELTIFPANENTADYLQIIEDKINEFEDRVKYSDGKDYSHLEPNGDQHPEHKECLGCGSENVTITIDADICHNCGFVYT